MISTWRFMMPELTGPLSIPCNNVHLFNYCSSFLASNPHLLCEKIVAVPEVNGQQKSSFSSTRSPSGYWITFKSVRFKQSGNKFAVQLRKLKLIGHTYHFTYVFSNMRARRHRDFKSSIHKHYDTTIYLSIINKLVSIHKK